MSTMLRWIDGHIMFGPVVAIIPMTTKDANRIFQFCTLYGKRFAAEKLEDSWVIWVEEGFNFERMVKRLKGVSFQLTKD